MKRKFSNGNRLAAIAAGLLCAAAMAQATLEAQSVAPSGIMSMPAHNIGSQFNPNYLAVTNLAVSPTGNFYFAIPAPNEVVEVGPDGSQTLVYQDGNWGSGLGTAIAVDRSGNLYLADSASNGVLEIATSGTQTSLGSGWSQPTGIAVDSAGNVYVADNNGVSKMAAGGGSKTAIFNNSGRPYSVAVDPSGNLFVGFRSGSQVYEITTNGVGKWLGSGLSSSWGIAVDGEDNVFVADADAFQVVELTASGSEFTVISSQEYIQGVAVDQYGDLFLPDQNSPQIDEFQFNGFDFGSVNTCPPALTTPAPCSQTISLPYVVETSGTLGTPQVVTQGASGLAFTLGSGSTCTGAVTAGSTCSVNVTFAPHSPGLRSGAVNIVDSNGNVLATTLVYGTAVGPQIAFAPISQSAFASVAGPLHTAVDQSGNLYVANGGANVLKYTPSGAKSTISFQDVSALVGVAVDGAGNLFVVDFYGGASELTTTGTQITLPISGLKYPYGITVDGRGDVFVADSGNNRIVELTSGGVQLNLGSGWQTPSDVKVDAAGDVFVADYGNSRVVELPVGGGAPIQLGSGLGGPAGITLDAAGNLYVTFEDSLVVEIPAGGGTAVNLGSGWGSPFGIAINNTGDLYVSDYGNNDVVKLTQSGPPSLSFEPTYVGSTSADSPHSTTVENIGSAALNLAQLLVTSSSFAQVDGSGAQAECTTATSLAPAASCNISISFTPQSAGSITGNITVEDNSVYEDLAAQSIALSGTGEALMNQTIAFGAIPTQTVGTPLTLSASASSGLAVSYSASPASVCTVSGSTAIFAGSGGCTIQASQSGNYEYNAATPVSQSFSVLILPTITFGPVPAGYVGGTQSITATTNAGGGVTLTLSSLTPSVCTISGQTASLIAAGTCTIQASEAATAQYAAATASTSFTVTQQTQTITFAGLPATATFGAGPFTLNGTASSGLAVSYSVSGPATLSGATLTITGVGAVVVTASQAGNSSYNAATSVSQTIVVSAASQTITFAGLPAAATFGAGPYSLNGTASSGLAVSYSFTGPATLSGSTLTITGVGTVVVTASQTGNANYNAATSVSQAVTVSQASQTITFTGLPATATYGAAGPYALNATATSGQPVSYNVTGPASISGSTLTISGAGTVVVTASQAGNTNYSAATSVSQTIAVSAESQTITFTGLPAAATYGAAGPYTLNGTATSGLTVSYSVTGPASISGSTLTISGAGTVVVTASQSGNINYAAATSVSQSIAVSAASQTITFNAIASQTAGASLNLSATATSGLTVSFASSTPSVCAVSGTNATLLAAGTCTIEATQTGNSNYTAATPVSQSFTVSQAARFTLTPLPASETITRGVVGAFLLQITSVDGFDGNVTLSCSGGPTGSECVDFPQTVKVNGTSLAVSGILFPANTAPGTYIITFTGVSGSLSNSTTAKFTVQD